MASLVFDQKQYELRGHLPAVLTGQQKSVLNSVIARVNGQLDWNAQFLGFNGPSYWGRRIATVDGSYKWKGLPSTVSEKRAVQVGAFGVYDKDKDYEQRPAPFNRAEVRASADLTLSIFAEEGKTFVVPLGLPRELLYEETPRLIVGGEYTFNGLVEARASNGSHDDSLYVTQDLSQGITSVRVLSAASEAVTIKLEGSNAEPFLFFVEDWEDISDWTSQQVLSQYIGAWGNKGNAISSHFLFDALDIHGFNEEEGLSLDTIIESVSLNELLALVGLKPGPAAPRVMSHYNFRVDGCSDLYQPTTSLETKFVRLQTEDYVTVTSEEGDEFCLDEGACGVFLPPAPISTDGAGQVEQEYTGTTVSVATTYNNLTVRGSLYYPTSSFVGPDADVIVLYHPSIDSPGVTPSVAATNFLNIVTNTSQINIRDKIIFSVAYPQDAIPAWLQNNSLIGNEFPELLGNYGSYANFVFGENVQYAEAALLWVKNSLNSYLSSIGVSKTTNRVFTFGHSQGGLLVHRLNTMHPVDGVVSNAPGPIDLLSRCSVSESQGDNNVSCLKLKNSLGSTSVSPGSYTAVSLSNFLSGTLSPALFTQALDDDTPQVANMQNIMQPGLESCVNCAPVEFRYYNTGGHAAFVTNAELQADIRQFFNSTETADRRIFTEDFDEVSTDNTTGDFRGCYEPPEPEFGECDTPNFALTLRQFFDQNVTGIATDPGPETSVPIGANGVQFLFPPTCFIDNGEYESVLGQFFLDGGDYDQPLVFTNSVGDGLYDRDPFSVCDGLPEDYERIIEGDDLIIEIAGEPGPVLMTDTGVDNEIEIVASGGDYDGFVIGFDGLELETVSFEYDAKTTYGKTRFPCVEWVFDPTLDNSTYFPVPDEAPWMGTDDGEYDRESSSSPYAVQSLEECVSGAVSGGLLSFDDGVFDEIISPNCDYVDPAIENCSVVDGGFYQPGINPLVPPDSNTACGSECGTVDSGLYVYGQAPLSLAVVDGGSIDSCIIYDNTEYDLTLAPQVDCIAYNNGSYAGGTIPTQIECVVEDKDNFAGGPYALPPIDDGFYTTSTVIEVFTLSTESGLELQLETGDLLGLDPAIIIPATAPPSCAPCLAEGTDFPEVDCTLDNGDFEGPFPPTTDANDGLYDRDLGPFCVPCQDPNAPVIPCPVEPVRVRLDQIIFSAPRWRMRPSVMNSLTPLRLWKNRTLNVPDSELSTVFLNPLVADQNSGPEDPGQYRHFARLPAEYSRNSKFWNRAESVLSNQSYFSRALPPSSTELPVIDKKPLLYDEAYFTPSSSVEDSTTFYVEDYLVSTLREDQQISEDGFVGARETFEEAGRTLPFVSAAATEYDAYVARKLKSDATRVGSYLKLSRRDRNLTGFLETDIENFAIRYSTAAEPIVSDASELLIPNVEFPDDPDEASFSNYVVSYAYFAADMSAADEPVFDPTAFFNHRNKALCVPEVDFDELTTEDGRAILTQDFESIAVGEREEIIESRLLTYSKYVFHDDEIPNCALQRQASH
jgi:hypothetical protein